MSHAQHQHLRMTPMTSSSLAGAIMGSSTAWFLTEQKDFQGRVLVIERDPSYEFSSTAHTNSCMRQQYSTRD